MARKQKALAMVAAISAFLAEHGADLWEDERRSLEGALRIAQKHAR